MRVCVCMCVVCTWCVCGVCVVCIQCVCAVCVCIRMHVCVCMCVSEWKQPQHPKLYFDLLQALKMGTFDSPGLPPGGAINFCICGTDLNTLGFRRWSQTASSPFTTCAVIRWASSTMVPRRGESWTNVELHRPFPSLSFLLHQTCHILSI